MNSDRCFIHSKFHLNLDLPHHKNFQASTKQLPISLPTCAIPQATNLHPLHPSPQENMILSSPSHACTKKTTSIKYRNPNFDCPS